MYGTSGLLTVATRPTGGVDVEIELPDAPAKLDGGDMGWTWARTTTA
jgi:hypothetical protein